MENKDYLHINGDFHMRVIGFPIRGNHFGTEEWVWPCFCVYTRIPLREEVNGAVLLKDLPNNWVPKNPTSAILYGRKEV